MNVASDDMNVALDDIIEKVWMDIQQHVSESGATNIGNVTGTDMNMNVLPTPRHPAFRSPTPSPTPGRTRQETNTMTPSPTITVSQAEHQAERMTCDEPSHRIERLVTGLVNACHRNGIGLPAAFLTLRPVARAIITQAARNIGTTAFFMGAWH